MPFDEFWRNSNRVILKDGTFIELRPEIKEDLEAVWDMFSSLSPKPLHFLPMPFTRERVEVWFKNIDYAKNLPILGIMETPDDGYRVISSSTLSFFEQDCYRHKATFGITVHDDYQNLGLGTILTNYMLMIASSKNIKKVELDVVSHNSRAIKVYERCGFKKEGVIEMSHWNYILNEFGNDIKMGKLLET